MKIFVLLSRFPYPLEKGDKLRAYHQIKELSKNHEIVLCTLSDEKVSQDSINKLEEFCVEIKVIRLYKFTVYFNLIRSLLFSNQSLQVAYFYNRRAQKQIDSLIEKHQPDHIYCQLIRVTEYVRKKAIPKTLDYMDALARGMERRVEESPFYLRWFLKTETTRLKRYEHFIFEDFDYTTIISEQDKNLIVNIKNDTTIVVPNGVDYQTYQHQVVKKEYDLIFTGNMAYPPNVDSVVYLANEIMPIVWEMKPKIRLVIVGAKPLLKWLN
jgi:glycosyltransferase involved in cell wall biosynthesis